MATTYKICSIALVLCLGACDGKFSLHLKPVARDGATGSEKFGLSTCVDPDPAYVKLDVKFSKCDGSIGVGTYAEEAGCSEDAQVGCVATANFVATVKSEVDPTSLRAGSKFAGVTGTKRAIKHCKNGKGRTQMGGTTTVPWSGIWTGTGSATVTNGSPTITGTGTAFDDNYGPGDVITISGQTRTIVSITSQTVMTADSNFTANAGPVSFTTYTPYLQNDVDDYQNNLSPYVGADATNCDASNMLNVTSASPPLQPSGAAGWSYIFQDQLSGIYFTNVLPNASWSQAKVLCATLDTYVTGGTGWRLPTSKELAQLYVNGATKIGATLGTVYNAWTSDIWSGGLSSPTFRFQYGAAGSLQSIGGSQSYLCVRE